MPKDDVGIAEVDSYCRSLSRDIMKNHEKRFEERIRSIRDACRDLNNATARFSLGVKNAWGTMEKTSSEYGTRLAQTILDQVRALSEKEKATTFEEVEDFHQDAVRTLNTIITTVRRYVPKMPRTLKTEMAGLNSALARLEIAVRGLGEAIDGSPGLKIRSLERDVQHLVGKHEELVKLKSEEASLTKGLSSIEDYEKTLAHEKETLFLEPEFLERKRLEALLALKADEIRQIVQGIAKPLVKLERLAQTKQELQVDLKLLRSLVDNPVETVMSTNSYAFLQILDKLEHSLTIGELGVEERKRRKADEIIELVRQGAFDKLRDECLALQANIQETIRQLRVKGLIEREEDLDHLSSETKSKLDDLVIKRSDLGRRIVEISDYVQKQKATVESSISKTLNRSVGIKD